MMEMDRLVNLCFQLQLAPLQPGRGHRVLRRVRPGGRGLHSSTFQLNLSALYGIEGARRGYVARVQGGLRGVQGVEGGFLCQTRLKLS